MAVLRKYARPMLASVFVAGGISTVRAPERVAPAAEPVAVPVASRVPRLPEDPEQLVRLNGAVHIGAGLLLATGIAPRFAALALAGTLVPTTLAGHAWWREKDPEVRAQQRTHFLKNVSLMGGLLIAAADTHGKPSVAYRARGAAKSGRKSAARMRHDTAHTVQGAADAVRALPDRARQTAQSVTG
ncbi:DoxX family membrane protein [Streptomyces sp. SID8379]|uniref:DoxX family protein n=1 Tax=unclassified Streptomyces TaxID=2593676 RepID=UPI0004783998|nr:MULTISPECIES: DoxX family protein [unclassified Streptomyces]MYW64277.1 DoxX family membrane protein [Streptomyces sp. SID8379]